MFNHLRIYLEASVVFSPPGAYAESVDSSLKFTSSGTSTWYNITDVDHRDGDSAGSGDADSGTESVLQAIVESDSSETVTFWWKVSCAWYTDFLRFYIDGTEEAFITGDEDWQEESFTVSSGIHTLKWVYEDGGGDDGENCGWVDFVQWTGPSPAPDPNNWQQIEYKYDVYGRRSEKKVDGYATRYVYDGAQVIAEYDGNNNLLRKYIYGPGIDQPVCMIEVADGNATYYYHRACPERSRGDALGSVIALSDSTGDTIQTYDYSVFGEPAVEDPNHTNPYMFAGRRYDIEIGLYYNRARYYNPYTGRFLQTDPIGYKDGMNWYAYCGNNPVGRVDPSGLAYMFLEAEHSQSVKNANGASMFTFAWVDGENVEVLWSGRNIEAWCMWARQHPNFDNRMFSGLAKKEDRVGWKLSQTLINPGTAGTKHDQEGLFWNLQALIYLGFGSHVSTAEQKGVKIRYNSSNSYQEYKQGTKIANWNPNWTKLYDGASNWNTAPPLAMLYHELTHVADDADGGIKSTPDAEKWAMKNENAVRYQFYKRGWTNIFPSLDYS